MTDWLAQLNEWVEAVRNRVEGDAQIPLIDDPYFGRRMGESLREALKFGDHSLQNAVENVARDPEYLVARFVALGAFYRLMVSAAKEETESMRRQFLAHLGYLVRLRDVSVSASPRDIRWEVVNACAAEDFKRACDWCDLLDGADADYFRGRLRFLIASRDAWNDREEEDARTLLRWDLPVGSTPGDHRGVLWTGANALLLYAEGVGQHSLKVGAEDRDYLWDAIKYLDKALDKGPPSARFMIARAYNEIGDHHHAARHYEWLLRHDDEQAWAAETEGFSRDQKWIVAKLHECLVGAYYDGRDTANATRAAEEWTKAEPDQPFPYKRLAELYANQADYQRAYETLRGGVDRIPSLGEDLGIRIGLALGGIPGPDLDELLRKVARAHAEEIGRIAGLLLDYWPACRLLDSESQNDWSTGVWLRQSTIPTAPALAVHSFARPVERELRANIFEKFRGARQDLLIRRWEDEGDKLLLRYLQGSGALTLGQMFTILGSADRSRGLARAFGDWLNNERPWFIAQFRRLPAQKIREQHIDEKHAYRSFTASEAAQMEADCRALIELIHRTSVNYR